MDKLTNNQQLILSQRDPFRFLYTVYSMYGEEIQIPEEGES